MPGGFAAVEAAVGVRIGMVVVRTGGEGGNKIIFRQSL